MNEMKEMSNKEYESLKAIEAALRFRMRGLQDKAVCNAVRRLKLIINNIGRRHRHGNA